MSGWAWALPHELESAARARRIVDSALTEWGVDLNSEPADDIQLAVSEAVGNAVTHGVGEIEMTLDYDGRHVTCQVANQGAWVQSTPGADDEHGRGLTIINALAKITKLETGENGTIIEFRVPLPAVTAGLAA